MLRQLRQDRLFLSRRESVCCEPFLVVITVDVVLHFRVAGRCYRRCRSSSSPCCNFAFLHGSQLDHGPDRPGTRGGNRNPSEPALAARLWIRSFFTAALCNSCDHAIACFRCVEAWPGTSRNRTAGMVRKSTLQVQMSDLAGQVLMLATQDFEAKLAALTE